MKHWLSVNVSENECDETTIQYFKQIDGNEVLADRGTVKYCVEANMDYVFHYVNMWVCAYKVEDICWNNSKRIKSFAQYRERFASKS